MSDYEYECQCDDEDLVELMPPQSPRPFRTTRVTTTESTVIEPVESEEDIQCECDEEEGAYGYSTPPDQRIHTPSVTPQKQRVVRRTVTRTVTNNEQEESDGCECDEDAGAGYSTPPAQMIPCPATPATPRYVRNEEYELPDVSPPSPPVLKRVTKRTVRSKTKIPTNKEERPRRQRRSRSIVSREEAGLEDPCPGRKKQPIHYKPWYPKPEPLPPRPRRAPCPAYQPGSQYAQPAPPPRGGFTVRPDTPSPPRRASRTPPQFDFSMFESSPPRGARRHSELASPDISPIRGHGGRMGEFSPDISPIRGYSARARGISPPAAGRRAVSTPDEERIPCPAYTTPEDVIPPYESSIPPSPNRRRPRYMHSPGSYTPRQLFQASPDESMSPQPLPQTPRSPRRRVCTSADTSQEERAICYTPPRCPATSSPRRRVESPANRRVSFNEGGASGSRNCSGCCGSNCCEH